MPSGFARLSAAFFSEILSRKRKQTVRVKRLRVRDYANCPRPPRGSAALKKVDLQIADGPLQLFVKVLAQPHEREALVWQFLQKLPEMPVPDVYHVEYDPSWGSYGVILEYVGPLVEAEGWDEAQCRRVGSALAAAHAVFWGKTDQLPDLFAAPDAHGGAEKVEPAVRRFLDRMSGSRHASLHAVVPEAFGFLVKLLRMDADFFQSPAGLADTLIHGALDPTEVLFRPHAGGAQPVLIDWERARIGSCLDDLGGLALALDAATRSASAAALLSAYVESLKAAGVGGEIERLGEELDRQIVLRVARDLPRRCGLYLERRGQVDHEAWCRDFLESTARDVAQARAILDEIWRRRPPDERTEIEWQAK